MAPIRIPRITRLLLALVMMLAPAMLLAADTTLTVTKAQDGGEVAVKVGGILVIELPGRGGTGYQWSAVAAGAPNLTFISQTTRQVKEGRPGGPVVQVWRFRAEKPGATELKMAYYRPWEGVGQAKDHFRLTVRIK
jgi:predicted secreted protein